MFIDRLRESSNLCVHPNDAYDLLPTGQDMLYRCRTCEHSVSVTDFLCRVVTPSWSPTLAREFAGETGFVDVPCKFRVDQFDERLVPETVVTRLSVVLRGLQMLRAVHSPFRTAEPASAADPRLFRTLLNEYMSLIDRVSLSDADPDQTVKLILTNMKDAFANVDMFDQYFNVLVPYVKRAAADRDDGIVEISPPFCETATLGDALNDELAVSARIRNVFSKYCVPFEVVHAMVLCYLCGDHVHLMYNVVLDFAARLCCGFFSFPVSRAFQTGVDIRRFLDKHVVKTENVKLYYHVQKYKNPKGLEEDFGENFLKFYGQLESLIRKKVPLADSRDKIERFIYQQTFPYILFEAGDDADYYAFVLALAHFASKSNLGSKRAAAIANVAGTSVPKGVEGECKRVYRFVKDCMRKVRVFSHFGGSVYWTKDTFELFVASDPDFAKELLAMINVVVPSSAP